MSTPAPICTRDETIVIPTGNPVIVGDTCVLANVADLPANSAFESSCGTSINNGETCPLVCLPGFVINTQIWECAASNGIERFEFKRRRHLGVHSVFDTLREAAQHQPMKLEATKISRNHCSMQTDSWA
eukprot:GABV01008632.1.p1 GENE.GABV01008632.1~~GABV01008632.1.p1  ORF type:complete len:129 (-),score=39.02 GABV01008632.1:197-583(-)